MENIGELLRGEVQKPSDEEIRKQVYKLDNYDCKVVTPWYRPISVSTDGERLLLLQ